MNMKKVLLILLILGITRGHGYCDTAAVQLQLTADKTEIFTTEFPTYTVKITNMGTTDLSVLNTDYTDADKVWSVDNPRVALAQPSYGPRLTPQGIHILKPGEAYEDQPRIFFPERISDRSWEASKPEPITLRVGFKINPDAQPVWSNPITISFKTYEALSAQQKVGFEEINLDNYCYPFSFHVKTSFNQPPTIENQLIINDEKTYQDQLTKIRRDVADHDVCQKSPADKICELEQECVKKELPPIDFSQKTILGQFTQGHCGTTGFKKEVFQDDKTKTVTYFVSAINTILACSGPGGESMNLIAVPKIPADYKVVFSYKFP